MILSPETVRMYASRFVRFGSGLATPNLLHLALVWLLALPAVLPLFQSTITLSADGLLHLYRVVALEQAVRQGAFFPRWFPDLAYGYGFPLFVYYAPLSYYLTLATTGLGLGTITGFNISLILAFLLAATGGYLLVKDMFGPRAGVLAGVAYLYAPFQLLNNLARGGLPAAWAMAIFPFVFWIFRRLIRRVGSHPVYLEPLIPFGALILGAALLMHNTLSLLFVPLFGLFLGVELAFSLVGPEPPPKKFASTIRRAGQVGLALFLGGGIAAFFLLPAILEKDFAQVERVIISPDFDFHYHFVTLKELFTLPQPANTGLLNPQTPLTLGVAQAGLAGIGWLALVLPFSRRQDLLSFLGPVTLFTTLALPVTILMMLPLSVWLWEQVPLLAFVQFPHRLLGPAALLLAILAGAAVAGLPERAGFGLTLVAILFIVLTAVPFLYPRYYDTLPNEPTLLDMMAYERSSGAIGATSFGEYLPVWVKQTPEDSPLEPMYRAGATVARLDTASLPPGAVVEMARYGFNEAELVIDSPQPHQAVFHTFYFPGWQIELDGEPGQLAPVTEAGLIGVSLPEGRHHLHLFFQETGLRRTANGVSLLAVGVTVSLLLLSLRRSRFQAEPEITSTVSPFTDFFTPPHLTMLAGLAVLLVAFKLFYLDRGDSPWKQTFDGATLPLAGVTRQINFGDQINLLGYDLASPQAVPGETFDLTLYWQARQPLSTDYSSLVQLVDEETHLYTGQDNLHPGTLPSTRWQPWGFVRDPHHVRIPFGTPPGNYFLVTGLYQPENWSRLPVLAGGETGWPDVFAIPVRVTQAARVPSLAQLDIVWPVEVDFGPELRLLGASPERVTLLPNDFLRLALFWEARAVPGQTYQVGLRLLSSQGEVMINEINQPSHNRYPTSLWQAGERVRDNHAFWIPAGFPAGSYRVQVQLLDEAGQVLGEWVDLGVLPHEK